MTSDPTGAALQEGARDTPRAEGHVLSAHHRGEEEPLLADVHVARRHHEGNDHRGERPLLGDAGTVLADAIVVC